jgi:hypothetical protein
MINWLLEVIYVIKITPNSTVLSIFYSGISIHNCFQPATSTYCANGFNYLTINDLLLFKQHEMTEDFDGIIVK